MWLCATRNNPSSFKNVGIFLEAGFTLGDQWYGKENNRMYFASKTKIKKSEGALILGCEKNPDTCHFPYKVSHLPCSSTNLSKTVIRWQVEVFHCYSNYGLIYMIKQVIIFYCNLVIVICKDSIQVSGHSPVLVPGLHLAIKWSLKRKVGLVKIYKTLFMIAITHVLCFPIALNYLTLGTTPLQIYLAHLQLIFQKPSKQPQWLSF